MARKKGGVGGGKGKAARGIMPRRAAAEVESTSSDHPSEILTLDADHHDTDVLLGRAICRFSGSPHPRMGRRFARHIGRL